MNKSVNFAELDGIPVFQPVNRSLRRFAVQSFNKLSSGDYINVWSIVSLSSRGRFL